MKIGLFDSGVGGLTVLKALRRTYPEVDFVYLGDTARVPYGNKSAQTVIRYSLECAEFLLNEGIDLLVVACNTASSYALEVLKGSLPIPVFGVIEPGVKRALENTKGKVGVIGTKATISSCAYKNLLEINGVEVHQRACPLFVPLVEEGLLEGSIAEAVVKHYLKDLMEKDIDTLILGCTHYPLLKPLIERFMGPEVKVIDSAQAIALEIEPFVKREGSSRLDLYFTDISPSLQSLIELILGEVKEPRLVSLPCKV
uniref:Glutamate racemase n=1 Tax=Hydrogenobacter sp. TaxID=2152829 RepID=A0A7C2VBP4_9AQUI